MAHTAAYRYLLEANRLGRAEAALYWPRRWRLNAPANPPAKPVSTGNHCDINGARHFGWLVEMREMADADPNLWSLEERIAKLEKDSPGPKEKQILRLGALAAVIATLLSIYTSVTQQVVTKRDQLDAKYSQFSNHILEMYKEDQTSNEIAQGSDPDAVKQVKLFDVAQNKMNSGDAALRLYPQVTSRVSPSELVELGYYRATNGVWPEAYRFLELAVQKSDDNFKPEVLRMQGKLLALSPSSKDRDKAASSFGKAITILKSSSPTNSYEKAMILHDWLLADVANLNCEAARGKSVELHAIFNSGSVNEPGRGLIEHDLHSVLSTQYKCSASTLGFP